MTKLIVDTKKLKENAKKVLAITSDFKYKIAVTKGNGYGHSTKLATKAFVKAGFNMFGLARFSECLETYEVVKKDKKIKIFSLSVIEPEHIEECIDKGFIVPITSLEQIQLYIQNKTIKGLNVQIVLNTGMNRIGFNNKEFIAKAYDLLVRYKAKIVGIFSHIFENDDIALSTAQFDKFEELLEAIPNWEKIPYRSMRASWGIANLDKIPLRKWETCCRPGTTLYGFASYNSNEVNLMNAFSVAAEIAHINIVPKGEKVGYGGTYITTDTIEYIGVVPCGWGDGIPRNFNTGSVYINGSLYPIVGRIAMDSFAVKLDKEVKINDTVYIFKDFKHACTFISNPNDIANVIAVICNFSINRVPRIKLKKFNAI